MQCVVAPAGRYSARNVAGHAPPNASASPVGRHELTEQGALAADVEVPAHHGARPGLVHDASEHGELGAVQRVKPVRLGPVTVMVGHRMGVDHAQLRAGQPGHQGPFQPGLQTGPQGNAGGPGRSAETPEGRARYRPPGERDQAAIWSERAGPIAHPPERPHPADQPPQVPVREHLLATDHVSIPGIKPGPDRGIPPSQLRPGQGDTSRIERRDGQQLTGHASHPSHHSGPGRAARRPRSRRVTPSLGGPTRLVRIVLPGSCAPKPSPGPARPDLLAR